MILSINALSWFSDTLYFDSFYLIIFMFFFSATSMSSVHFIMLLKGNKLQGGMHLQGS